MKQSVLSTINIDGAVLTALIQAYVDGGYANSEEIGVAIKEPASFELARLIALETSCLSVLATSAPINVYIEELKSWKDGAKGRPAWAKVLQYHLFTFGYEEAVADSVVSLSPPEIRGRKREFEQTNESI